MLINELAIIEMKS